MKGEQRVERDGRQHQFQFIEHAEDFLSAGDIVWVAAEVDDAGVADRSAVLGDRCMMPQVS